MRTRRSAFWLAASLAALSVGCGNKKSGDSSGGASAPTTSAGEPSDDTAGPETSTGTDTPPPGDTGAIAGTVSFTGDAPDMPTLKRAGDPFCAKTEAKDTSVVVNPNGTLANVVVRIKPGTVSGPMPDEPVSISQSNCMYEPRVVAAMVDQPVQFTNDDQTMHNIHAYGGALGQPLRSVFNLVQPPGAPALERPAAGVGRMEIKCDVHPWMQAIVLVSDHPFADTTRAEGTFRLEGVPVGNYELEAWHELFGTRTAAVEVAKDGTATVDFSFEASEKIEE